MLPKCRPLYIRMWDSSSGQEHYALFLQHSPTLREILKLYKTCWPIRACRQTCQSEEEEMVPPTSHLRVPCCRFRTVAEQD